MFVFYKKILTYPKTYKAIILFICFVSYTDLRLWQPGLYIGFALFAFSIIFFSNAYIATLKKNIENYRMNFRKIINPISGVANTSPGLLPVAPSFPQLPREDIDHIVSVTHLITSFWLIILPGVALLFQDSIFAKFLILFFLLLYILSSVIRRIAYKLHISQGRTFLLIIRSLVLTGTVSFLPFFAMFIIIASYF